MSNIKIISEGPFVADWCDMPAKDKIDHELVCSTAYMRSIKDDCTLSFRETGGWMHETCEMPVSGQQLTAISSDLAAEPLGEVPDHSLVALDGATDPIDQSSGPAGGSGPGAPSAGVFGGGGGSSPGPLVALPGISLGGETTTTVAAGGPVIDPFSPIAPVPLPTGGLLLAVALVAFWVAA